MTGSAFLLFRIFPLNIHIVRRLKICKGSEKKIFRVFGIDIT